MKMVNLAFYKGLSINLAMRKLHYNIERQKPAKSLLGFQSRRNTVHNAIFHNYEWIIILGDFTDQCFGKTLANSCPSC